MWRVVPLLVPRVGHATWELTTWTDHQSGSCEHESVRWVKQGPLGVIAIWCCPKSHAAVHRQMLEIKGFSGGRRQEGMRCSQKRTYPTRPGGPPGAHANQQRTCIGAASLNRQIEPAAIYTRPAASPYRASCLRQARSAACSTTATTRTRGETSDCPSSERLAGAYPPP